MNISHPSKRTVIAGASALTLAMVGITAGGVASAHHQVTLELDGVSLPVEGFYTTVDDVLESAGVNIGEHDLVAPATSTRVRDGDMIVVRMASAYVVNIDGEDLTAWSTADSIDGVLDSINSASTITLAADRSKLRSEMPVVTDGTPIILDVDGTQTEITASGKGADKVLADAGVTLGEFDRFSYIFSEGKTTLKVTRVSRETVTEIEELAYSTQEREDDTLYQGETSVIQAGVNGSITRKLFRETVDGQVTVNRVISETKTEATNEIVAKGTKERTASTATASAGTGSAYSLSADSSGVWAALAQCESGGNPATNTGNGYYGLYQFSLSTWRSVGGTGLPSDASAEEQTARAQALQARAGWGQWPSCTRAMGLY